MRSALMNAKQCHISGIAKNIIVKAKWQTCPVDWLAPVSPTGCRLLSYVFGFTCAKPKLKWYWNTQNKLGIYDLIIVNLGKVLQTLFMELQRNHVLQSGNSNHCNEIASTQMLCSSNRSSRTYPPHEYFSTFYIFGTWYILNACMRLILNSDKIIHQKFYFSLRAGLFVERLMTIEWE